MARTLLVVTALFEAATGVVLLASPSTLLSLLLDTSLDTPGGLAAARVAGGALLAIATACWLARDDARSRAGRAVLAGMLVYNIATIAVLAHASAGLGATAIGFWPAVGAHAALAVWCVAVLRSVEPASTDAS